MQKIYFLVLILSTGFIGCQKAVDSDKLLDAEEKVFITGYLSPTDTLLRVRVSKALPAIGTLFSVNDEEANRNLFLIKDAFVNIRDTEGNEADLMYSEELSSYVTDAANLSILEGSQYFLSVTANGLEFNANCRIPKKIENITETVIIIPDEFGNNFADINVSFTDFADEQNFYIIGGFTEQIFEESTFRSSLFFESGGFLTDVVQDGLPLSERTLIFINDQENMPQRVTFQVAHVEETIFQNLRASDLNRNNDGNPFIEFSIAPNNIEGENGIGVFAGFQLTEKMITIEQ